MMNRTAIAAPALALFLSAPAFAQIGGVAPGQLFQEIPGNMEFMGSLIAKPINAAGVERIQMLTPDRIDQIGLFVIDVPLGETENSLAARLIATGDYEYVEPNWRLFHAITPNDSQFNQQWHHPMMNSTDAWDITTGDASVVVAIVDSGVDLDHPDLEDRLVPGFNSVTDTAQVNGGGVGDLNGHGSACAGSAAAIGNNGIGVAGMGWNLGIMPIRASDLSSGSASSANLYQGAIWASDNGARVVSVSYTGVQSSGVQSTGEYLTQNGDILVWAANNSSQNHSGFDHDDVIVVGATDQNDNRAGFSSFGRGVDVFAPGVSIRTTNPNGGYTNSTGTSFATPIAAGVLGSLLSVNPDLSPQEVIEAVFETSVDKGSPGNDDVWGWGRIDYGAAATRVANIDTTPLPPVAEDDLFSVPAGQVALLDALVNDSDPNFSPPSVSAWDQTSTLGGSVLLFGPLGQNGDRVFRYFPPANATPGQTDTFQYTLEDPAGLTDTATVTVTITDPSTFPQPVVPVDPTPGLRVAYYDLNAPSVLPDFDALEPFEEMVESDINFQSTNGNFADSNRAENFGAVFEGLVNITAPGTWTFYTDSDDGSKLFIGGELVVDNDGLHGMQERSGSIDLLTGRYPIRVEFFERGGGAGLITRFEGPGTRKQTISALRFSFDNADPCVTDINGSGAVDLEDLLTVLANFGTQTSEGDVNSSGTVDLADLLAVLADFGTACP